MHPHLVVFDKWGVLRSGMRQGSYPSCNPAVYNMNMISFVDTKFGNYILLLSCSRPALYSLAQQCLSLATQITRYTAFLYTDIQPPWALAKNTYKMWLLNSFTLYSASFTLHLACSWLRTCSLCSHIQITYQPLYTRELHPLRLP
jgi:hypothetical protein